MHEGHKATRAASCRRGRRQGRGLHFAVGAAAFMAGLAGSATLGVRRQHRSPRWDRPESWPGSSASASRPVCHTELPFSARCRDRSTVQLDVALRPRDPAALARFASAVSTPGSPEYPPVSPPRRLRGEPSEPRRRPCVRRPRRCAGSVCTSARSPATVSLIKASATVATAERAFATTLVRYRLASGALVYANLSAPRIPSGSRRRHPGGRRHERPGALLPGGSLAPRSAHGRACAVLSGAAPERAHHSPARAAAAAAAVTGGYTADQLASAYGFSDLYAAGDLGAGETIAIFELEPFSESDVHTYEECYFPDPGRRHGVGAAHPLCRRREQRGPE